MVWEAVDAEEGGRDSGACAQGGLGGREKGRLREGRAAFGKSM